MQKVMVVGGPANHVQGSLTKHLEKHGIEIGWHAAKDWGKPYTGIPSECQGLIVISNVISHGLHDQAIADAKERGIPFARVQSKWSKAEPVLRMVGILDETPNQTTVSVEDLKELAFSYVTQVRREDNRVPRKKETRGILKRAFGENAQLSETNLDHVYNQAAAEVPLKKTPSAEEMQREVVSITRDLIKDDPRMAASPDKIRRWILSTLDSDTVNRHSRLIRREVYRQVTEIRERWSKPTVKNRSFIKPYRYKWLKDWFTRAIQGEDEWPSFNLIRKRCRDLFGHVPNWDHVKPVRAEVLGSWALELKPWFTVQKEANKKYGDIGDLLFLLEQQKVQGIRIARKGQSDVWMTSLDAVEEYLHPPKEKPPEKESPEKESPEKPAWSQDVLVDLFSSLEDSLLDKTRKVIGESLQPLSKEQERMEKILERVTKRHKDLSRHVLQMSSLMETVTNRIQEQLDMLNVHDQTITTQMQSLTSCIESMGSVGQEKSPLVELLNQAKIGKCSVQLELSSDEESKPGG